MILSKRTDSFRDAFTLVELLVVIAVMAILGGMVTIALSGANATARQSRARSQVDRLNLIVLQLYEEEAFRGVAAISGPPRRPPTVPPTAAGINNAANENVRARNSRQLAILNWKRDYLRCVFPDSVQDLIDNPVEIRYQSYSTPIGGALVPRNVDTVGPSGSHTTPIRSIAQDRLRQRAFQTIASFQMATGSTAPVNFNQCVDGSDANGEWTIENQSAECLYLVLSVSIINGRPASDNLRGREIADTDGDGIPEIVDAWENPVGFMRWPAGFYLHQSWQAAPASIPPSVLSAFKPDLGEDPFDILRVDPRLQDTASADFRADDTFNLLPMVVSAGPDGDFDLYGLDTPSTYSYATATRYSDLPDYSGNSFPHTLPFATPFAADGRFVDPYTHDQSSTVPTNQRLGVRLDSSEDRGDSSGDNLYPVFDFS